MQQKTKEDIGMNCRHCGTELKRTFVDLGKMPPSNSYLSNKDDIEKSYPLKVLVCDNCLLVQTEDFVDREEMFSNEYAYFSSMSQSFLEHSKDYVDMIMTRLHLNQNSRVVEIACNDGYLLQYFKDKGLSPLGIEPTDSTARVAREKGIEVIGEFFGKELAERIASEYGFSDLIIGNNVLAHVPDINDFLQGVALLLHSEGTATFEFPHLLNLIKDNQFDTIYHEHYSYLSLTALVKIFEANGLNIYHVKKIPTHGGSLRVYAGNKPKRSTVQLILIEEQLYGLNNLESYETFQYEIERIKMDFDIFRTKFLEKGHKVAGYGAAAKANTFLNYVGADEKFIPMVADITPAKQGKFLPGSRIPIVSEEALTEFDPDFVIIFPWNFKEEIMGRLQRREIVRKDCKFVTFIPELRVYPW
jgi:SAM-dependent methyltransferase